jgi:hypothetical protein
VSCFENSLTIFIDLTRAEVSEEQYASEQDDAEERQRKALEYEEEEIPPELAVEIREAEVSFPNLPMPRSSDGEVRQCLLTQHSSA